MIERAKAQVKEWYSPRAPTKREFIETNCVHMITDSGTQNKGACKIFILEGGEPKGIVIANYHDRTVIAFGIYFQRMKIYRLKGSLGDIYPYEERTFYTKRKEHLTPDQRAEEKEITKEANEWFKAQRKIV